MIIDKLPNIGLSNSSIRLLESYLKDRTQIVYIGNEKSEPTEIRHGVGQGTILGPLLFKLYLADMVRATNLKVIHFADDTTFVCSANNKEELMLLVNSELEKIWTQHKIAVFDVDVAGALQLKEKLQGQVISCFISVSDIEELKRRLIKIRLIWINASMF